MQLLQVLTATKQKAEVTIDKATGLVSKMVDFTIGYAPKIVGAILFYLIGTWLIKKMVGLIAKFLQAKDYDPSLESFLLSIVKVALTILLFVSIMGIVGVDTGAFSALIVGAGVAIGGALNGSLGNLAGGVMMLIFKPFKVGDMIEAQGITGMVAEQGVFNTTVLTPEHKTVFIPNGPLSTGVITNYTSHGNLRVDLTMAISPNTNIDSARSVAIAAMLSHPKVLKTPIPEVNVLKVGDGMVTLTLRPYCVQADYWDVYFGAQELVKNAWDKHGVDGPTPHRVVITKNA